jgi:hypothetical protein
MKGFDLRGNSAEAWRGRGMALLNASRALMDLWDDCISFDPPHPKEALDYDSSAVMLRGMAVECFLKARFLERVGPLARGGKYVGPKSHDLVRLAERLDLTLDTNERDVLRGLSRHIVTGRYPIAILWSEQTRLHDDGMIEPLMNWNPYMDGVFENLVGRINEGWSSSIEAHWKRRAEQRAFLAAMGG